MNLYYTSRFKRLLKQKTRKNSYLKSQVKKQLNLLLKQPTHPSIRLHKLKGKRIDQYSIFIEENLRITFLKQKKDYILTDIISHDQY